MTSYACKSASHRITRRQMLASMAGAAGVAGLTSLVEPAIAEEIRRQRKQVLFIWIDGGMSQLESWDPKPRTEFGGPFRAIPTSVPGTHVSELIPRTARHMHHLAVVRGMCTKDPDHSTGVGRIQRGDPLNRGVTYPFLGSAVCKFIAPENGELPPYVHVKPMSGGFLNGDAGFLGPRYGALALGDGQPPVHIIRPAEISAESDETRNALRMLANRRFEQGRRTDEPTAYDFSFQMAQQLMRRRELFDLGREPAAVRDRYGRHPLGRHMLLARRLLEAGITFVKVTSYGWDTHADNFHYHMNLMSQFDRPFSAIIDDLDQRGMLDNTLVIAMSEFGRTPKINEKLGRDHWPNSWSLVMAGCGIRKGIVFGRTHERGAFVADGQVDIGHIFHTVFAALGVRNPRYRINGQPLPAAHEECAPIRDILS
jgi:uncharacterized protein (DUF1501 family)